MGLRLRPLEQYGFLILLAVIFLLPYAGIDILGILVGNPAMRAFLALTGY
jgi:hypothetical protein